MPYHEITVSCPVHESFRVAQVAGMFDLALSERAVEEFKVELPGRDEPWRIGLIVGPSGSGKSTVARHALANHKIGTSIPQGPSSLGACPSRWAWPADQAVIDSFGDLPTRRIVELFTAVGFGSPPSWIKPYRVLSGGEQFRCDLARALAAGFNGAKSRSSGDAERVREKEAVLNDSVSCAPCSPLCSSSLPLVVFDEFTSLVDRDVAKIGSAAIAKGIRNGRLPCRFVAVTCHYDVIEWLEPDWVLDMATSQLQRRRLRPDGWTWRRPPIELEIHRCGLAPWQMFRRHHYLNRSIAPQARCYLATWNGLPVNFSATLPLLGKRAHRRFTRIVTLPDFQGVGIGMRVVAAVAELHRAEGLRISVTSSHPALVGHCRGSPRWKVTGIKRSGSARAGARYGHYRPATGRAVVSFEYVGRDRYES